jgi:hypothetical protein
MLHTSIPTTKALVHSIPNKEVKDMKNILIQAPNACQFQNEYFHLLCVLQFEFS